MYYIGHTKPDTDSVCAAIAAADFYGGTPAIAGPINKETQFVLDYFNIPTPKLLENISNLEMTIIDHNQTTQAPNGYENANIKRIIDHHALQDSTYVIKDPIEICMQPWGSSSTIVANKYIEANKEIPKAMAGIMLASILSDTLCFQSPTTTEKDKEIANILKPIAGIEDFKEFSKEMFSAKSNISHLSAKEILHLDAKDFNMNGKNVAIGIAETVNPEVLINRKTEFIEEMNNHINESDVDYMFFFIIDILNQSSTAICANENHIDVVEKTFNSKNEDNLANIGSLVSRKKQIAPALTKYFTDNA